MPIYTLLLTQCNFLVQHFMRVQNINFAIYTGMIHSYSVNAFDHIMQCLPFNPRLNGLSIHLPTSHICDAWRTECFYTSYQYTVLYNGFKKLPHCIINIWFSTLILDKYNFWDPPLIKFIIKYLKIINIGSIAVCNSAPGTMGIFFWFHIKNQIASQKLWYTIWTSFNDVLF